MLSEKVGEDWVFFSGGGGGGGGMFVLYTS